MVLALVRRWWGPARAATQNTVELACGGRVAIREEDEGAVLTITTAPDGGGRSHTAAVALRVAEQAELSQALVPAEFRRP
jgi:hypothetical protein